MYDLPPVNTIQDNSLYGIEQMLEISSSGFIWPIERKLVVPVDKLEDPDLRLKKPIYIFITESKNGYAGFYKELGVYTFDEPTLDKALKEVQAEIMDLYDQLMGTDDSKLGPILRTRKTHLDSIIRKV